MTGAKGSEIGDTKPQCVEPTETDHPELRRWQLELVSSPELYWQCGRPVEWVSVRTDEPGAKDDQERTEE